MLKEYKTKDMYNEKEKEDNGSKKEEKKCEDKCGLFSPAKNVIKKDYIVNKNI